MLGTVQQRTDTALLKNIPLALSLLNTHINLRIQLCYNYNVKNAINAVVTADCLYDTH